MNLRRMAAVAHKEWREVRRDRLFFALSFVVPVFLMLLLGFGMTFDVENIPFAVVDYDRSPTSRDYAYRFISSRYFDFQGYSDDLDEIDRLLEGNRIRAAIVIPEHFGRDVLAGRPVTVQTVLDGTIPSRAETTKSYLAAINAGASTERLVNYVARRSGLTEAQARVRLAPVGLEVRYLYNQAARSIWSLAPKFIMFILLFIPPVLTAVGVVREKETGSIYNVYASTVTRGEFLAGKLCPYLGISVVNVLVLWAMAVWVYGAPFKGDPLFFFFASVVFVTCATAIGLVISLLVQSQVAAIFLTVLITLIPAMDYSGFLIPIHSLDEMGQILARLLPFMYYTDIVTGSFLKGLGAAKLWTKLAVLSGYTAALLVLSYCLFTKRPST